jgi:Ca2+-binding RTX toxin-like protein
MSGRSGARFVAAAGATAILALALTSLFGGGSASAAPAACTAGPTTSAGGTVILGTPCADTIVVSSPAVTEVRGGEGNDLIYASPNVETILGGPGADVIYGDLLEGEEAEGRSALPAGLVVPALETITCSTNPCFGGAGSQNIFGGAGNDTIFGQRGNDTIHGEGGDDALYGGVGDDTVFGNEGSDLVAGGLGADELDGNNGNDVVRGDGTTDTLKDTGGSGTDTLSFATAVTPGFSGSVPYAGFPGEGASEERGIYVRLDGTEACTGFQACDNSARWAGGNDTVEAGAFENVVGSPFDDLIVGSSGANRIDGGGGADAILGQGGNDTLYGGADGDYIDGGEGTDTAFGQSGTNECSAAVETKNGCSGSAEAVHQRNTAKIAAGLMATEQQVGAKWEEAYAVGSSARDVLTAAYRTEAGAEHVSFETHAGSAEFDTAAAASTPGCTYTASKVDCVLPHPLDSILLSGMDGEDELDMREGSIPITASGILVGGQGNDTLRGNGSTEDVMSDGPGAGNDSLFGFGSDDGLLNNEGADNLQGGNGNDLLVSANVCEGDTLQGAESGVGDGSSVNSASFAQLTGSGVAADLEAESTGTSISGGVPACLGGGTVAALRNIDDLEGSQQADQLFGDGAANNLLGRPGKDGLFGRAGADNIEAADGEADQVGGGEGTDSCTVDKGLDTVNSCP